MSITPVPVNIFELWDKILNRKTELYTPATVLSLYGETRNFGVVTEPRGGSTKIEGGAKSAPLTSY